MKKIKELKDELGHKLVVYENEGKYFVKTDSKETIEIDQGTYNEIMYKGKEYKNVRGLVGTFEEEKAQNEYNMKHKEKLGIK